MFIASIDEAVANWMYAHATPTVTALMRMITTLGAPWFVLAVTSGAVVLLLFARRKHLAIQLGVCVVGGMLFNTGIKHAFDRARPSFDPPLAHARGFSFPSGHVAAATLLYGTVALLAWRRLPSRNQRITIVVLSLMIVQLVALSRIYLVVHYVSDVVAAQVIAIVWIAICSLALGILHQRSAGSQPSLPPDTPTPDQTP